MKQLFVLFTIVFLHFTIQGQNVSIYYEKTQYGFNLIADNKEIFPVSIKVSLTLDNMSYSKGDSLLYVVPAKKSNFILTNLYPVNAQEKYKFNYIYWTAPGDVRVNKIDKNYSYSLPFETGKTVKVFQGYNGKLSHQNQNAIDFSLSEGTKILAAREGIVVQVEQSNNVRCPEKECEKYNNYITILHPDGSFGGYYHIQQNGSLKKVGDIVKKDEPIGYSGNVGRSTGPHLHFIVYAGNFKNWDFIETLFRINNGDETSILQEGVYYTKKY